MNTPVITSTKSAHLKLPKGDYERLPLPVRLMLSGALMTGNSLGGSCNASRDPIISPRAMTR